MDMKYSDEHIERCGHLYQANRASLQSRNITFLIFVQYPDEILSASVFNRPMPCVDDYYPLLDEQLAVQHRLDDEWGELEVELEQVPTTGPHKVRRSNGKLIEPLEHNAYPVKRGQRCCFNRRAVGE